ncbi:MAG TPA: hypothetical protein VGN07_23060 [Steroidobacteraceae bacterium]
MATPGLAENATPPPGVPQYALDTSWPKLPLPNNWTLGWVNGIHVDAHDHMWVLTQPQHLEPWVTGAAANPPSSICCVPAPPVVEFDAEGNVLRSWGGPGKGYDWPSAAHGIYTDYKGNVWIGGSQTRPGADGSPPDGMILKFTPDGKFLMQIGGRGASKGSVDTTQLSGAAGVVVDPQSNEVFVADGYGNHRVIVFDADTGKFKRQWGAYGKPPTDEKLPPYDSKQPPSSQFHIVHCVNIAQDGLVYVCDRLNDRLQVFKRDGTFVTEYVYAKETRGSGSVGNVTFWPDATQSMMAINDPGNFQTVIVRRATGEVLSRFGHFGTYGGEYHRNHQMELDSRGYLYTSEDYRVQRFKIVNGVQPKPQR